MKQAIDCDLFLYADDSCLVFQHKNVKEIEINLNKNFSNLCDWFVDNRLSIHFGEYKTKSILFAPKNKIKKIDKLDKVQCSKVTYLGCILDESLSGESMALYVMDKINNKIKFLYRKSQYLTKSLRRLLCNALIQPHFDYACSAWYPNLNKKPCRLENSHHFTSSQWEVFCNIGVLRICEIFKACNLTKNEHLHRYFSRILTKNYEHLFYRTPLGDCFCHLEAEIKNNCHITLNKSQVKVFV